jgi:uncharacterized RDD family membrane protein YckC
VKNGLHVVDRFPHNGPNVAEPSRVPPEDGSRLREIPGLRKRERTWKDEVRERVAARKRKRAGARGPDSPELDAASDDTAEHPVPAPEPRRALQVRPYEPAVLEPRRVELGPPPSPTPAIRLDPPEAPSAELGDLPLQPDEEVEEVDAEELEPTPLSPSAARDEPLLADALEQGDAEGDDDGWELDLEPPSRPRAGVERPAPLGDRALAAAIDGLLLGSLYAVVVYFASRAAQTAPSALAAAWPWLIGYMLLLGLAYAGCFTGFTGQTPGKMWTGLRVVDGSGRAPGVWHAVLRAAAAIVGIAAGGAGLIPVLLDPARRATHDRLLGTRVVTR